MKAESKERYHYTECGLKNVYIDGLHFADDDGEKVITIPNIHALHWLIAKDILESKSINGDEIRFLRTEMGYTPKELAKELEIAERTLKSMENGKTTIKESVELKLRQLGFSLLVVPKWNVYSTPPKRRTRQIKAIRSRTSISTYRLDQTA
ncbi:MAG: helix-turn-helix domain-containing protein [Chromatiales bacterium]|nr:helix-turn-helix domain-containing protein [Chromatiales bacterium]